MSYKTTILTIVAAAVVIGLAVAGCNQNRRRTAMAPVPARQGSRQGQSSRPAEVMAATVSRPAPAEYAYANYVAQRQSLPVYVVTSPAPVYAAPASAAAPVYRPQPQMAVAQPGRPVQYAQPVSPPPATQTAQVAQPVQPRVYHPTPDLAMASAFMQPQPVAYQPAPVVPRAPIPDLSPSRTHRLPVAVPHKRPAAEIMMSSTEPAPHQEVQRALAPLPQADPVNGWVASPTTAMRTWR